jgi:eukaryotic-like serine/threonine-protein kinase
MEHVAGLNLEQLLVRVRRLSPEKTGALLGKLCVVLQAAHDQGILHRDLSAPNLMITDPGTPRESLKVMDFGLARATGFYIAPEKLQGNPNSFGPGTPDYLAPEQIRGDEVNHRSDLYSVGAILFQMLTGRLPFHSAKTVSEIVQAHLNQSPPSFEEVGIFHLPAPIEAVVQRCLAKFPPDRPDSARELAELYGAALGQPIVKASDFVTTAAPRPAAAPSFDERDVLDRFEAWMPEQVAAMKLRGFVQAFGGEVLDSAPGVIRVRLRDGEAPAPQQGVWGWLKPAT